MIWSDLNSNDSSDGEDNDDNDDYDRSNIQSNTEEI